MSSSRASGSRLPRTGPSGLSSFASLSRALSPSAQAAASAGSASTLAVALSACTSVEEIVVVVPTRYSESVAPLLRALADNVERATSTFRQRRELTEARTSGEFPKWLLGSIGIPTFQPMGTFASSPVGSQALEAFRRDVKHEQAESMRRWIVSACDVLDSQHRFYLDKCTGDAPEADLVSAVKARTTQLCGMFPVMRDVEVQVAPARVDAQTGAQIPRVMRTESQPDKDETLARYAGEETKMLDLIPHLVEAVRAVVTSRHVRRAAKDTKKAELKRQAEDVEMRAPTDDAAGHPAPSFTAADLRRIVREEVAASTAVSPSSTINILLTRWLEEIEEGPEGQGQAGQEEVGRQGPRTYPEAAAEAEGWKRQRETARGVMCDRAWVYDDPRSYPDEILDVSPPLALKIIAWRAPQIVRDALKFRHPVHVQTGLLPPDDILSDLGVGMRYIMPITIKPELPLDAWTDFERRFRWFYWFSTNEPSQVGELAFEPDYVSTRPKSKAPGPLGPSAIESGLAAGRTVIASWQPVEPTPTEVWARRLAPGFRNRIQEWVLDNEVIITPTDKNLGLALISRDWFVSQTRALLQDEHSYRAITLHTCLQKMQYCVTEYVEQLGDWESSTTLPDNKQLCEFLWDGVRDFCSKDHRVRPINTPLVAFEQRCLEVGTTPALLPGVQIGKGLDVYRRATPQFYGLPKIHKEPWAMRPIMPCHSAILAHPNKVLSKLLKMLIAHRPYVLEGTKALCVDLQKVVLPSVWTAAPRYWLISADIVAFYPNVDTARAAEVIRDMWLWFCSEHPVPKVYTELFDGLLRLCTELPSVCQFQEEYFEQVRGLAMGMHCAPDLANLFAAAAEEAIIPTEPGILFYRRYIDDLLFLVQADTAEDALACASKLSIPGCELKWSTASQSVVFLDVFLWISPVSGLQWKPYAKPLNHLERIPWISAHEMTVKRGTFMGEISRLAILSSTEAIFRGQLSGLASLYRARGYPDRVLSSWLRDARSRWTNRFAHRPAPEDALVLKTEMNPVWNSFPIRQLADVVQTEWKKLPLLGRKRKAESSLSLVPATRPRVDFEMSGESRMVLEENANSVAGTSTSLDRNVVDRRLLLSKRRVRNVSDLFNTWKKQLIYSAISDAQSERLFQEEALDE